MDKLEAVLRAREALDHVTPLHGDCGRICGAACCAGDESGKGGMLLLPGEEALYASLPPGYSLIRDDSVLPGLYLLTCSGTCSREERPYSCRIFPLTPVLCSENGSEKLKVRVDPRSFSLCPLSEQGIRGMDRNFSEMVLESARILCACPEHRAYFLALHRYLDRICTWDHRGVFV